MFESSVCSNWSGSEAGLERVVQAFARLHVGFSLEFAAVDQCPGAFIDLFGVGEEGAVGVEGQAHAPANQRPVPPTAARHQQVDNNQKSVHNDVRDRVVPELAPLPGGPLFAGILHVAFRSEMFRGLLDRAPGLPPNWAAISRESSSETRSRLR